MKTNVKFYVLYTVTKSIRNGQIGRVLLMKKSIHSSIYLDEVLDKVYEIVKGYGSSDEYEELRENQLPYDHQDCIEGYYFKSKKFDQITEVVVREVTLEV